MTITVYPDIIFPNSVMVAGVTGTKMRQNDRGVNQGGYATVNVVRDVTLNSWQIGTAPLRLELVESIIGIYEATDAGAFGFLLEDPIDSSVTASNGALIGYMAGVESGVVGFGNGTPNYGFRKVYTASGSSRKSAKSVTRINGTPSLTRNGAPVTIGVSAGNAAISAGPSYVVFVADDTRTVSSLTLGATTTVTLPTALSGMAVGGRLWLQGLTGADAALLNNLAHPITAIASNVYTLGVNTAGKAITTGAGAAHKYPQPTDALAWSGSFYIPVHFRDDNLEWDLAIAGPKASRFVTIPSTYLDEVREA